MAPHVTEVWNERQGHSQLQTFQTSPPQDPLGGQPAQPAKASVNAVWALGGTTLISPFIRAHETTLLTIGIRSPYHSAL